MKHAPIPDDEQQRLEALKQYDILDTLPEQVYDDIVAVAAAVCGVPIALVSLVDENRQWFKSRVGLDAEETPRDISFCGHVVADHEMLVVPDATKDERFADNPLVTDAPDIRFYAGVPLVTPDDEYLGTLCVIDRVPRELNEEQLNTLQALGRIVVEQLELRLHVTRLRTSEAQLEEATYIQKAMFDVVVDGMITITSDGVIESFNPAASFIFGYSPDEVIGRNVNMLMPDYYAQEHDMYLHNYIETGTAKVIGIGREVVGQRKDRSTFPMELAVSEMRHGDKRTFVGLVHDVTERQQAEAALRQSEERFHLAVSGSNDGIWDWNIQTGGMYYSPRYKELLGYEVHEFPDKFESFETHLHPDDRDLTMELVKDHLENDAPYDVEYRLRTKANEYKWFRARGRAVRNDEGQPTRMAGSISDITDRKEAAFALLDAKDAAEAANKAKSTFLANMSHELRTPLNAIIGYSEMLEEEATEHNTPECVSDLQKIQAAGKHLLALINDILDLSKVEAGKMELHGEAFQVALLLDDVVHQVQPLLVANDNTFKLEVADNVGNALTDRTRLRQILYNLLSNAGKFTENGTITLGARLESHGGRDFLVITVADTGVGMTPEQVERVFGEFTQADASTTRKYGGTGLGLTITQKFCRLMGGEIFAESEAGKGSTFTVRIPAELALLTALSTHAGTHTETESGRVASTPVTPAVSHGTVLAIDDDPAMRELLERSLSRDGYYVETYGDGRMGLARAREIQPDVVILDVMMPDMDGWQALTAMKNDPELRDIPVVMLTMVDEQKKGFALGASDYLTKPLDRARLKHTLARFTGKARAGPILLVEDDAAAREMVRRVLEKEQWQVLEADGGEAAMKQLTAHRPALILLDLMMPDMNGFEFVERIQQNEMWRTIPIVVLTAMDMTRGERDLLNGYIERVLQKATTGRDELVHHVQTYVKTYTADKVATDTGDTDDE